MSENLFIDCETVSDEVKQKALEENIQRNSTNKNYVSDDLLSTISNSAFDFDAEKKKIIQNLDNLTNYEVEEFTFYKKWEEMQLILQNKDIQQYERQAKGLIWQPTDVTNEELTIKEIQALQPRMVLARGKDELTWTTLRYYCSTAEYNQAPGRFMKFLLMDDVTGKVLGITSIASDVISISDRDKYLGWTPEDKLKHKMLKHSAIGTTIVPTQPLGSNFLGGKLTAAMVTSKIVRDSWEFQDYGDADACKMVGMTTTSLYGRPSMYDGMKWWDGVGLSKGKIPVKPDESVYQTWHGWLKQHRKEEYDKAMTQKEGVSGPVTGAKMRVLSMIFKACGIKQTDYTHGYERGVYYSCFYQNTKEFLQRKISEKDLVIKPLFKNDTQAILDWWKPAAIKRYKKLKEENRLNPDKLYYSPMSVMTYPEAKERYFKAVGK